MKHRLFVAATTLMAVGLLELVGLTSSAAAFASAAPSVETSGIWYFAYGARYDEVALKESFSTGPSNQPHLAGPGEAPVGVYLSGYGPTYSVLTNDLTPANRSEGRQSQRMWFPPAPQSCSPVIIARADSGSKN